LAAQTDFQGDDSVFDERATDLEQRQARLIAGEQELEHRQSQQQLVGKRIKHTRNKRRSQRKALLRKLEELSGQTEPEQIELRVREIIEKIEFDGSLMLREAQTQAQQEASTRGRAVMGLAAQRYTGVGHLERVQNVFELPSGRTFEAYADPQHPCHLHLAETIPCELLPNNERGTITIRGEDPLAREMARRVLRQAINRKVHNLAPLREIVSRSKTELDREVQNAARKAARVLRIKDVHPEVLELVGRLKFRLSYSQNQWKHAVEVGYLSGMMAAELGLDIDLARRGGLLHDIGKAMTHDHEGAHAVLGAEVARRCGEVETVANAIGSHHNDEAPATPIAHIVTAADAMSGARPGARRETAQQYLEQMATIQRIATRSEVVERVDIMNAGREVRVIVPGNTWNILEEEQGGALSDDQLHSLALEIAEDLESELTYAGQIRVTVIRESKAVCVAR
jgi:ribonuclease Y